jgi:hypothetical protein
VGADVAEDVQVVVTADEGGEVILGAGHDCV